MAETDKRQTVHIINPVSGSGRKFRKTVKNLTDRPWPAGKYDLLCKLGSEYLIPGSSPRVPIQDAVARGTTTEIKYTLDKYVRNGRMVFYVMDGNNSFYHFYIRL